AVAAGAEAGDLFRRAQPGAGDRRVGEPGGDGLEVVAAGPVAPLAADAGLDRERPGPVARRADVGGVAAEALVQIVGAQRPPEEPVGRARLGPGGVTGGHVPAVDV